MTCLSGGLLVGFTTLGTLLLDPQVASDRDIPELFFGPLLVGVVVATALHLARGDGLLLELPILVFGTAMMLGIVALVLALLQLGADLLEARLWPERPA